MNSNTSSLFGGGGLGGGLGLGASAAPQTSSLFGTNNATTSAPGTSTFGTTQGAQSSLFGASQAQPQPAQPSLLGQSSLGQTQSQANPGPAQAGLSTQTTQPAFFNSLLERGKKRPLPGGQNGNFENVPSLQLGLDDIRRKARELGSAGIRDHQSTTKAHYLLASSGITPGRALRDLQSLDPQAPLAAAREIDSFDPDNQRFLRNMQQRGRQVMVAESLSRAQRDFDTFLEEKVDMDWEEQRQKIFEHFGLSQKDSTDSGSLRATNRGAFGRTARQSKQAGATSGPAASRRSVFGRSGLDKSVIGTPGSGMTNRQLFEEPAERNEGLSASSPDLRFQREKMRQYADKVQQLNVARLRGQTYPIFHQFSEVEVRTGGDSPHQLFAAYQALAKVVGEKPSIASISEPGAVKERQFVDDYLEESNNSRKVINLKKRILEGSRTFLEQKFYADMEDSIAKNPRQAQLGGIPTVINKIRAYIRLRASRKDLAPDGTELQLVGSDYCWILIYYLLRCGFVKEAAEYVSQDPGFRSMDHKFVTYMTTYAQNRRLPRDLQQKINGEYQQRSRNAPDNTVDPYRMACYLIIGRCDLSRRRLHDGVNQTVEDWTWLQFSLAREDDRAEEVAGDVFGLEDIQTDISEIGQRMFTKGQDATAGYGTYFFLQILGGMYEQAVSYLGTYAPVTAVHFAIALSYYGLLRVSDFYVSGEEVLSFTVKQYPQINFGYLITQYTREFRTGFVEAAVDYFTLICLNADLPGSLGKSQASVCHEALREFILETRDFAKLLGDMRSDGSRIKGIIEQRLDLIKLSDEEDFLKNITDQAAGVADDKGLVTDAVLLYHLAEHYDRVIEIINRALSDAIAVELGGTMQKLQPLRPRNPPSNDAFGVVEPESSLSLTSVDDPVVLAKTMLILYNSKPMYYEKIRAVERDTCGLLICMMDAKIEVEAGRWAPALDAIDLLGVLPLQAHGSMPLIRSAAQSFSGFPEIISRNVGHVIMWCIACIGNERQRQTSGPYETDMHAGFADRLLSMAKDLMIFSGMVKYKLPPKVYEALARAAADIGAY
ncbi:Nucleoporin interacting component Nup93/Nic96 [Penicillium taxi]|uniref:Nucleoporin interacting component Nup93/Nic96 n=1 Tax=Penicillium taxi TaxID=168475 RepID=UPI002544F6C7|nr:Nucleoporin interacting component Nup93/Nic96 [Penicillium taxi]KAJ5895471.1 Nucleoporin interacting component Nup93/Nic96 [Penicillium taxi]